MAVVIELVASRPLQRRLGRRRVAERYASPEPERRSDDMTADEASLIIAVGLIFGAAVCRLTVWARSGGEHGTAVAQTYLTPLADWALATIAGHALALILTGVAGVTS
jgi:hypothetical protein